MKFYYLSLFFVTLALYGCNQDNIDNSITSDNNIIKFDAYIDGMHSTRAVRLSSTSLSQFGVFSFYNNVARSRNVVYTKENSAWIGDKVLTWAAGAMDFYGISPSFKISTGNYNLSMNAIPKTITYSVPTNSDKQIDIMYSSIFNLKSTDNNGSVVFAFKPAMHYVSFLGQNALESNYQVLIKTLIVHNLISNGTFTFATSANNGDWTSASGTDAVYVNDTINLKQITELTSVKTSLLNDEYLILMPQTTTKWNTTEASPIPIATADQNHNYYVEVIGQIIRTETDGSKTYLLGNADNSNPEIPQYESVYFPEAGRPFRIGGGSTLPITFNGGYNKDGQLYIEHIDRGGSVIVKVAEWEPSDFNIEEWTPYYENIEL